MNNFSIFTICTENYKDGIDFAIPSWLKLDSVDKIYIYTDFDLVYENDRVIVLNKINKTGDWLEIVGLKAVLLKDFLSFYKGINFAFIDIDCYIVKDISHVFDKDFDIAATRMFDKKSASSGVWFCRNNENINGFCKEWINEQNNFKKRKIGVKPNAQSYSQKSFSHILHKKYKENKKLKVLPLDVEIYNSNHDNIEQWLLNINKYNPNVLHFKGCRFRDKKLFEKIIGK